MEIQFVGPDGPLKDKIGELIKKALAEEANGWEVKIVDLTTKPVEPIKGYAEDEVPLYRHNMMLAASHAFDPISLNTLGPDMVTWLINDKFKQFPKTSLSLYAGSAIAGKLVTDSAFGPHLDMCSDKGMIESGYYGKIMGLELFCDAYFHPNQRCLEPNVVYLVCESGGNMISHKFIVEV